MKIVHGLATEVILHVPDGVHMDILKGAWYKIQVPHLIKNIAEATDKIKVKYQDRHEESVEFAQMLPVGEDPPINSVGVYYRLCHSHVEIFTPHFSQLTVYAENTPIKDLTDVPEPINCTRSAELLVLAGADPGFDQGGPQIVTGLKLPFWGLSFVEFWCWGLIFGGQGGPGPLGPHLDPPLACT